LYKSKSILPSARRVVVFAVVGVFTNNDLKQFAIHRAETLLMKTPTKAEFFWFLLYCNQVLVSFLVTY
jgi:hypothetical protein